jgi:hypothetical protein
LPIGNGFGHPAIVEIVVVVACAAKINDIERFAFIVGDVDSAGYVGARRN